MFRYPEGYPQWQSKGLPVAESKTKPLADGPKSDLAGSFTGWQLVWTLLGIFAGGLALNLTPCVYPLIPITVSYFGGRSGTGKSGLVGHGICYIGGLSLTNSFLGVMAALTGGLMGAMLQNPLVLVAIAAVMIVFASSLFGLWELRLPFWLTQAASKSYSGFFGSFFMGITLGVVAAPCIGPFVLGLLTWVAALGDPLVGFVVFFTLSLGLGTPLFVLALFSGRLTQLPKSGEWMNWVRRLMGWVLVAMAAYFLKPILPVVMQKYLLPAIAIAAGCHLGWLDKTTATFRSFAVIKILVCHYLPGCRHVSGRQPVLQRPIGQMASIFGSTVGRCSRSKQTGHHRFLCHLVRPLPRTRRHHLPSSRCGQIFPRRLHHGESRSDQTG